MITTSSTELPATHVFNFKTWVWKIIPKKMIIILNVFPALSVDSFGSWLSKHSSLLNQTFCSPSLPSTNLRYAKLIKRLTHLILPHLILKICGILHHHIDIQLLWFVNLIQGIETENQNCKFAANIVVTAPRLYYTSHSSSSTILKIKSPILKK